MGELVPIKDLVDDVISELKGEDLNKFRRIFIALWRNRKGWGVFFDDFQLLLKRIEKCDPDYCFFPPFMHFLSKEFEMSPWKRLYGYLENKGYSIKNLTSMKLSYDEGALCNRLPTSPRQLYVLIFFLYTPRLTLKFFIENLLYTLSEEEESLLSNFQALPWYVKKKALQYVEDLNTAVKE